MSQTLLQQALNQVGCWLRRHGFLSIGILWMLIAFSGYPLMAQESTITVQGKVTDIQGAPIAGASVSVAGSTTGTMTNDDGNYSIEITEGVSLVYSYVGYVSQTIAVDGQRIDVQLELDAAMSNLEEVVVVGYGTQRRETITGSVASVKSAELMKSPTVNVSNALAGRLPGVVATQGGAEPGYDGAAIRIRGTNTLGNSGPLIVIDGIPARAGGFERLNPADIDNISVLKDASAAIYGARAANGVILITTKRGQTGKPSLSYTFNQAFSQPTVIPELADAVQYAEMRNELEVFKLPVDEWQDAQTAFRETGSYTRPDNSVLTAPYLPEDFQLFADGSDPWGHPNTDWYGATLKNWSPQSQHNLQISGGTEDIKYLTSLGYQNQDAYYKNSATGYSQYDIRVNLDANINQYISTKIGILGRQENRQFPTKSAAAIFRMLMRGIPTEPAYWPNGMPGPDIEYGENPVVITTDQTGYDRDKRYYFQTNGQLDITIPWVEGLKFSGTASIDKYMRKTKRWEIP